ASSMRLAPSQPASAVRLLTLPHNLVLQHRLDLLGAHAQLQSVRPRLELIGCNEHGGGSKPQTAAHVSLDHLRPAVEPTPDRGYLAHLHTIGTEDGCTRQGRVAGCFSLRDGSKLRGGRLAAR